MLGQALLRRLNGVHLPRLASSELGVPKEGEENQ